MEIRILEYFLAIAKEGNISNAAKLLHISQPSLSRMMMELEEELGVTLFTRSNRSTTLTLDGLRLKKRAEEIVSLASITKKEFETNNEDIYGEINIGAGETIYFEYIAKAASQVRQKYPNIHFNFYSGNAHDVIEKLNNGLLDFGLLLEPVEFKNFEKLYLHEGDQFGVLVKGDSPLSKRESIDQDTLLKLPIIISRKSMNEGTTDWYASIHPKLNVVSTCNLSYNALQLVYEGLGNFVSCFKHEYTCYEGIKWIPLEPRVTRRWIVAWKTTEVFPQAQAIFLEELKQVLNQEIELLK